VCRRCQASGLTETLFNKEAWEPEEEMEEDLAHKEVLREEIILVVKKAVTLAETVQEIIEVEAVQDQVIKKDQINQTGEGDIEFRDSSKLNKVTIVYGNILFYK